MRAAALPTPGLAALAALKAVNVQRGQTLLVVGATGGVGSYVVQLAARQGATVLATARMDSKDYIRRLGATEVFDHTQENLVAIVMHAHPERIDAVVDMVNGQDALERLALVLRPNGRLTTTVHSADEAAFSKRGIHATNVDVFGTSGDGLDELNLLIEERPLEIHIGRRFSLSDTSVALATVSSGHTRGKLILTIP